LSEPPAETIPKIAVREPIAPAPPPLPELATPKREFPPAPAPSVPNPQPSLGANTGVTGMAPLAPSGDESVPRFRSRKPWLAVAVLVMLLLLLVLWLLQQ
jgi:hypothetical protein